MLASDALMATVREAVDEEAVNPCGMGMVYAARSFFSTRWTRLMHKENREQHWLK